MSDMAYPLPRPNSHTQPFWEGAAQGELRYQRCTACGNVQLIPRSLCEECQSTELEWKVSKATGTVLTVTVVHRAPLPVFKSMTPYAIVIIDMDEGFRVMANALAEVQAQLEIGRRVRVGFQEVQGVALPVVVGVEEGQP